MKQRNKRSSERWIGLTVLAVGVLILLRNLDLPVPSVLFSWPMILIVIGAIIGLKENFKGSSWLIMIGLGGFFLLMKQYPEWNLSNFIAPAILIAIGLSFLLRRKNSSYSEQELMNEPVSAKSNYAGSASVEDDGPGDKLEAVALFGAVKKLSYSKNFKGGESVAIFGGSAINLMNADFTGIIKLELVNVFGGTTLFIPAHWQIRSEAIAIFGAIEDKRKQPAGVSTDKIVVIEGFVMFGGIDIKSIG
ncbi:MAG: LiaF transmembrane domain-containing protein [Lacibacter sp.]